MAFAQSPAPALTEVKVGSLAVTNDAGIFIADAEGYFAAEGLRIVLTTFRSASDMVPLLAAGELDVGGGSPSAGLYNALLRDVRITIVADKSYSPPGYGSLSIMIRRDLIDSGRFKGLADLKGLKIGITAPGVVNIAMLNTALVSVGLRYGDVQTVGLTFPDHPIALKNGAVDGAATAEPFATLAVENGSAVKYKRDDEIDPGHQLGCLFFSEALTGPKFDVGVRFLRAYLKGVRLYNRALKDGRLAGEAADEVIAILARYTSARSLDLLRRTTPAGLRTDGRVDVASLQRDFDFYRTQGWVQGPLNIADIVDERPLRAALESLGGPPAR